MQKKNKHINEIKERPPIPEEIEDSVKRNMTTFAKASFIDRYPDVRDGLKPVARRTIYVMLKMGLSVNGGTIKCAAVVGNVIGYYHPHGDIAAYGALVALGQPFTTNHKIIQGQGNFGNPLGDGAAAYRYTECKFAKYSTMLTRDLNENTVEFVPTYDRKNIEPTVLPAIVPNLLINGVYTIGGAAFNSSIPSHNLKDVCELVIDYINNPKMTAEEIGGRLMPDFPCGGVITNPEEVKNYYVHGTPTSIKMCGVWHIDTDHNEIHITELPYLVSGGQLRDEIVKKWPKLKEIGIDSVTCDADRDSDNTQFDVTIKYTKGTDPYKLIELLKSKTKLTSSSQLIFTCVIDDKLMVDCTIKDMLVEWLYFRRMVVRKSIIKHIQENYRKAHILDARIRVYDVIKKVVDQISKMSQNDVVPFLMNEYGFTVLQAEDIANIRVKELTKDSKETLIKNRNDLIADMNVYRSKLNDHAIDQIIIDEQKQAIAEFGRPRRTKLDYKYNVQDVTDNIPGTDTVISLNSGASISVIRSKFLTIGFSGKNLAAIKDEKFNRKLYHYNTKDDELFAISNFGYIYKVDLIKSFVESATVEQAKWANLQLKISPRLGEEITDLLVVPKLSMETGSGSIVVINRNNCIKRMSTSNIPVRIQKNGTRFIPIVEGDPGSLVSCIRYCNVKDTDAMVMYITKTGAYHLYPLSQLSNAGKMSSGALGSKSTDPIVDVSFVLMKDMICEVGGGGQYSVKYVKQLPQKRRNSQPGKIDGRMNGKTRDKSAVGLARITPNGTLVTDINGWFGVVDFNSTTSPTLTNVTDGCIEL